MTDDGSGWIVMREGRTPRWGGEVRRRHVFARLASRTAASVLEAGWSDHGIRRLIEGPIVGRLPVVVGRRLFGSGHRGRPRPRLAASEKLRESTLETARALTDPAVVAIYDDPVAQSSAMGLQFDRAWLDRLRERQRANVDAFRWHVVPTLSFAELAGLDLDRVIVGGNGTDTTAVQPGPWPDLPAVGIVSAAAPGRGLELLVEAVELARSTIPELRLLMWLVATSDEARPYLDGLRARVEGDPLTKLEAASYHDLATALARATVLCIAHPPNEYMDVALPVKLFDSMAAGRPLIVTPRSETRTIVERYGVGVVTSGDTPEDFAASIVSLCTDLGRARQLGARARIVAEQTFDWSVVGDRIADEVLRREDRIPGVL